MQKINVTKKDNESYSILNLRYIRTVRNAVTPEELEALRRRNHFIYLVSYVKHILPKFRLTKKQTAIISLEKNIDDIFSGFKKNTRNEIRKTETLSPLTFRVGDGNVNDAFRVYIKAKKKDGALLSLRREFEKCHFANAYWNDKMIVTIASYDCDDILRLKTIASLRKEEGVDPRVVGYATRRLVWEICKYGKKNGYKKIDLGGINFSQNAKQGIAQFKQSFGGEIVDEYTYRHETPIFHVVRKFLSLWGREIF